MKHTKTVQVLRARLPEAQAALEKLVRKAARHGLHGIGYTVARHWEEVKTRRDWTGRDRKYTVEWTDLEVTSGPLKVGSHSFLARLEVTPDGTLVDKLPGVELDAKWMTWGGDCEHCRVSRARKHLFVVQDNTCGKQLAVGRSCLRAFLGTDTPSEIAAQFAFWSDFGGGGGEDDGWGGFGSFKYAESIASIVAMTAVVVRLFGWCSKAQAEKDGSLSPTSARVAFAMDKRPKPDRNGDAAGMLWDRIRAAYSDEDEGTAAAIIAWVRDSMRPTNEYTNNLRIIFTHDRILDPKRHALVVSAYAAWDRARGEEIRKGEESIPSASAWVGTVKQRIRDLPVFYDGSKAIGTDSFGGEKVLVSFLTEAGDTIKWFTNAGLRETLNRGDKLLLTGTVKDHMEYRGKKETTFSRCIVTASA